MSIPKTSQNPHDEEVQYYNFALFGQAPTAPAQAPEEWPLASS